METKKCTKCHKELPLTFEYFYRDKYSKDGFRAQCKSCQQKYAKQYYTDHPEYKKQWWSKNKERNKKYNKRWYQSHKENRRILDQKRYARKRQLVATLTEEQWEIIKSYFNCKCAYCGKEKPLEQEHFIPIANKGEYTHNNIIPACKNCNSSKNNMDFFDWYPKQKFYSKKREQKILKFLGYAQEDTQQPALII